MHARVVRVGEGVLFREVSSVERLRGSTVYNSGRRN